MEALHRFYVENLGFPARRTNGEPLTLEAGTGTIEFAPCAAPGSPFYHFALLVPGDRYDAARAWAARSAELLSRPGETSTTFWFDAWDADACYFHDPAGNIVELIAHRGVCETPGRSGPFHAGELAGISEMGMVVVDPPAAARTLASSGLRLWSGGVEGEDALGFIGRQAHTLILCPPGRPWLPTRRPAECHPVTATLIGAGDATVVVSVAAGTLTTGG
jgi:catechol 2,3-dioxygenase-like lactoylglutathione lyase family enzyme